MQSHMCQVYECLTVTSHLHFWQNNRDRLHATAITQGWNGYQNKSQHRKLTLEKKILPPLLKHELISNSKEKEQPILNLQNVKV